LTAPYFHDGSAKTLKDAVGVMGKYQLGRPLKDFEVKGLVAFLKTLTGEVRSTKR
jgi:cytochrome c peroxidase